MNSLTFSLIIPVYNVAPFLNKCLDSVLCQTYDGNYEVICVNDGSTDASPDILEEYRKNHSNLIVINQTNKGLGEARNEGLKHTSGEYIWFIDSDDWIQPNALELLYKKVQSTNSDIYAFSATRVAPDSSKLLKGYDDFVSEGFISTELYIKKLLLGRVRYFAWNKLFKRTTFVNSGHCFPKGWYEDITLINFFASAYPSIYLLEEPLYNYLIRTGSIMNTYDSRLMDLLGVYKQVEIVLSENHRYEDELVAFYFSCCVSIMERANKIEDKTIRKGIRNEIFTSDQYKNNTSKIIFNSSITFKRKVKILFLHFGLI